MQAFLQPLTEWKDYEAIERRLKGISQPEKPAPPRKQVSRVQKNKHLSGDDW